MEPNPYIPRQRNRRTERPAADAPAQMPEPLQPTDYPSSYPVQQNHVNPQPVQQPCQPTYQPAPQQTVSPYARPVQQTAYPPQPPSVRQPDAQGASSVRYAPRSEAPRPRALQQHTAANSGWQTPTVTPSRHSAEAPHARQGRGLAREQARQRQDAEKARRSAEKPAARQKLPSWMTTLLSLMLIGVMALVAAYSLMNAYLTTQEQERQAAYRAILSNHHVTEQEDGTLAVTWQETIEQYAAQYNLQPAFVTAIIRNESSFDTRAESSVGARGLMQMMPDTAEWIAGKLDDDRYTFDSMWDAETNIRYGCWYLGYLSELFGGDPILVACAYHAGQGEVRSWLGDSSLSPDGRTVPMENIPISKTKTYAGRVTQAYGIYQSLLYPETDAADAVSRADAVHLSAADR